jgi:hypothetical protein
VLHRFRLKLAYIRETAYTPDTSGLWRRLEKGSGGNNKKIQNRSLKVFLNICALKGNIRVNNISSKAPFRQFQREKMGGDGAGGAARRCLEELKDVKGGEGNDSPIYTLVKCLSYLLSTECY